MYELSLCEEIIRVKLIRNARTFLFWLTLIDSRINGVAAFLTTFIYSHPVSNILQSSFIEQYGMNTHDYPVKRVHFRFRFRDDRFVDRGPRETGFTKKKVKPAASYIPRTVAPRKRAPPFRAEKCKIIKPLSIYRVTMCRPVPAQIRENDICHDSTNVINLSIIPFEHIAFFGQLSAVESILDYVC